MEKHELSKQPRLEFELSSSSASYKHQLCADNGYGLED